MALINVGRFRDVLVRSGVAEEAPALEVSVGLDAEIDETLQGYPTGDSVDSQFAQLRSDFQALRAENRVLREEMRRLFAEQEARHQQQLNRLAATMLGGAALIAAIAGVLVAVLG